MGKHPYFREHTFDKAYTQVNRSYKLSWNQKALINHIITWQEATDENGKPLNLVCFESNTVLAENLGIPFKTFEQMIGTMNREYDFFQSAATPGKGRSRNGGNFNRTTKKVDLKKLSAFLEAEQKEIEANGGEPPAKRKGRKTVVAGPVASVKDHRAMSVTSQVNNEVIVPPDPVEDRVVLMSKADAFKKIHHVLEDTDFTGPDIDLIRTCILEEIESRVVGFNYKDQLAVWLDDYIRTYLLIEAPKKRKVESHDEWQNRKMREEAEREYAGVEYSTLFDGLGGL